MADYEGPIEVGMTFLWEPMKPHATVHIKVASVVDNGEEKWIETRSWVARDKVSGGYDGDPGWNDEGRFREAVIPVPDPRAVTEAEER